MPIYLSKICKTLHNRRHSHAKAAKQRAQENEAWRCVRGNADVILRKLQNGEATVATELILHTSFDESQARWITLQFLEAWGFVTCSQPLKADANMSKLIIKIGAPVGNLDEHARLSDMKRTCWLM